MTLCLLDHALSGTNGSSAIKTDLPISLQEPFSQNRDPVSSPHSHSRLSSPFTPRPAPTESSTIQVPNTPPFPSRTTAADLSDRPPGGEIDRIRAEHARALAAQMRESEARRPEYLRRARRTLPPADAAAASSADPGLGITETPVRGRRLELWGIHETSEESFEERLMAGGYSGYGSTGSPSAAAMSVEPPRTPQRVSASRALEWASFVTPGPAGSSSAIPAEAEAAEGDSSDKTLRKRRRLEAFEREDGARKRTLHPVEVEGKGRVLLDVTAEELPELIEDLGHSPTRRRGGRRKRRGAHAGSGKTRGKGRWKEEARETERDALAPDWPDLEFPWCLRTFERREREQLEHAERMKTIARFFETGSDEDESEEEKEEEEEAVVVDEGGRKLMFNPCDPADARAVLLSKRCVRALASGRQLGMDVHTPEDEVVCVCHGRDDGRELVQCDECRTWYHLECIGVKDISELGQEEDPWFCHRCVVERLRADDYGPVDPAMVLMTTVDLSVAARRHAYDPLFYQGALTDSPIVSWAPSRPPTTPTNNRDGTELSTRSSWGDSSRHGPSTPRTSTHRVQIYTTPDAIDPFQPHDSPFDPTSTPSRGIRFGAPFATPKGGSALWAGRMPTTGPFSTPSKPLFPRRLHAPSSAANTLYDDASSGFQPSSSPTAGLPAWDDTPVDRTDPRPIAMLPRRSAESPLMGRGIPKRPELEDSPLLRATQRR